MIVKEVIWYADKRAKSSLAHVLLMCHWLSYHVAKVPLTPDLVYIHIASFPPLSLCQIWNTISFLSFPDTMTVWSSRCLSGISVSWITLCWKVENKEASGHFNSSRLCSSPLPSYVCSSFLLPLLWLPVILDGSLQWYSCWVRPPHHCLCIFGSFQSLVCFFSPQHLLEITCQSNNMIRWHLLPSLSGVWVLS